MALFHQDPVAISILVQFASDGYAWEENIGDWICCIMREHNKRKLVACQSHENIGSPPARPQQRLGEGGLILVNLPAEFTGCPHLDLSDVSVRADSFS